MFAGDLDRFKNTGAFVYKKDRGFSVLVHCYQIYLTRYWIVLRITAENEYKILLFILAPILSQNWVY